MASGIVSPSLATPRPVMATLFPAGGSLPTPTRANNLVSHAMNGESSSSRQDGEADGTQGDVQAEEVDENGDDLLTRDGRSTPIASDSTRSHSSSSDPTQISPNNTSISSTSHPSFRPETPTAANPSSLPIIPAEIGLSTLSVEQQLREALLSKDRVFVLMVSTEIERFIKNVQSGTQHGLPQGTASTSIMASLGPAVVLSSTPMSKFQRMLVYKISEWYGLKAVAAPDGGIVVGVVGQLNEKSATLRLTEMVPRPASPKQSFKIMQRSIGVDGVHSRGTSANGGAGEGAVKKKTLEEREAEYALARERIYGKAEIGSTPLGDEESRVRTAVARNTTEEIDPVSRHAYGGSGGAGAYPVYPSLYHPPKPDALPPAPQQPQYQPGEPNFAFQMNGTPYSPYTQVPMNGYANGNGQYPPQQGIAYMNQQNGQQYPVQPAFVDANGNPIYLAQGYPGVQPQWQQQGYPVNPPDMIPAHNQLPVQQMPMNGSAWGYPTQMPPMVGINQGPMPMIPQGIQAFPTQYPYPPHGPMYPNQLVQPTPLRPQALHQHSSASSSISSRSYQDGSRPHSRGSTTSTRSATSSVRLGAMYPAGSGGGPNYRQKGMKGQAFSGMTSLGLAEKRRNRGHSPSSATTTSSRSSRRTGNGSIPVNPPQAGQHQLPQRPDWAADNIEYHPSPMPMQSNIINPHEAYTQNGHGNSNGHGQTSEFDFPPLLRNGPNHVQLMQIDQARSKNGMSGNVWNGAAVKVMQSPQHTHSPHPSISPSLATATIAPTRNSLPPQLPPPQSTTPAPPPEPMPSVPTDMDPDFPRRVPSNKMTGSLYDPSAPKVNFSSRPSSAAATAEDAIEAKLAALSISAGISIGPPVVRNGNGSGSGSGAVKGVTASYAKVARKN